MGGRTLLGNRGEEDNQKSIRELNQEVYKMDLSNEEYSFIDKSLSEEGFNIYEFYRGYLDLLKKLNKSEVIRNKKRNSKEYLIKKALKVTLIVYGLKNRLDLGVVNDGSSYRIEKGSVLDGLDLNSDSFWNVFKTFKGSMLNKSSTYFVLGSYSAAESFIKKFSQDKELADVLKAHGVDLDKELRNIQKLRDELIDFAYRYAKELAESKKKNNDNIMDVSEKAYEYITQSTEIFSNSVVDMFFGKDRNEEEGLDCLLIVSASVCTLKSAFSNDNVTSIKKEVVEKFTKNNLELLKKINSRNKNEAEAAKVTVSKNNEEYILSVNNTIKVISKERGAKESSANQDNLDKENQKKENLFMSKKVRENMSIVKETLKKIDEGFMIDPEETAKQLLKSRRTGNYTKTFRYLDRMDEIWNSNERNIFKKSIKEREELNREYENYNKLRDELKSQEDKRKKEIERKKKRNKEVMENTSKHISYVENKKDKD